MGFPRHARITRGAELQRIVQEGKRLRTSHLEVRAVASPLACSPGDVTSATRATTATRVGLIVPRFRHSAVARNQLKRRLRELSRIRLLTTGLAADVVIRIRPDAYRATFGDLASDVDRAIAQLVRWRESVPSPTGTTPTPPPGSGPSDT